MLLEAPGLQAKPMRGLKLLRSGSNNLSASSTWPLMNPWLPKM
jgi:hypothetical protein